MVCAVDGCGIDTDLDDDLLAVLVANDWVEKEVDMVDDVATDWNDEGFDDSR